MPEIFFRGKGFLFLFFSNGREKDLELWFDRSHMFFRYFVFEAKKNASFPLFCISFFSLSLSLPRNFKSRVIQPRSIENASISGKRALEKENKTLQRAQWIRTAKNWDVLG